MPSGSLVYDPSQLSGLNPGANMSGGPTSPSNTIMPAATTSIGGSSSPFVPAPVTGTNMPAYSSPYSPSGATASLAGTSSMTNFGGATTNLFGAPQTTAMQNDIAKGMQNAGFSGGVGTALSEFLMNGAGFNPAVAQALIAAMQPQIAKGQANLMGQFGAQGLAGGSPAALGMGDYLAQTNLDVGTLLSGMYEQSVSNYMDVLLAGKTPQQQGGGILGALGSLLGGIGGTSTGGGGTVAGDLMGLIGL